MLFIEIQDCVIQVTITSSPSLSLISCKQVAPCLSQSLISPQVNGLLGLLFVHCNFQAIPEKNFCFQHGANGYYKVVKPNKYQAVFKPRNIVTTALLAWIIPMTFVIISVFVFDQEVKPNTGYAICVIQFPILFLTAVLGLTYSPYFIIIFCYWKIYRKVKMHNANLSWQSSIAADVKVSKTLFVTVVSFLSLLLPAHTIFTVHGVLKPIGFPRFVSLLAVFLLFMTSCINPFIYGYMNRAFKSEFKKFLMPKRGHSVAEGDATGQNHRC